MQAGLLLYSLLARWLQLHAFWKRLLLLMLLLWCQAVLGELDELVAWHLIMRRDRMGLQPPLKAPAHGGCSIADLAGILRQNAVHPCQHTHAETPGSLLDVCLDDKAHRPDHASWAMLHHNNVQCNKHMADMSTSAESCTLTACAWRDDDVLQRMGKEQCINSSYLVQHTMHRLWCMAC